MHWKAVIHRLQKTIHYEGLSGRTSRHHAYLCVRETRVVSIALCGCKYQARSYQHKLNPHQDWFSLRCLVILIKLTPHEEKSYLRYAKQLAAWSSMVILFKLTPGNSLQRLQDLLRLHLPQRFSSYQGTPHKKDRPRLHWHNAHTQGCLYWVIWYKWAEC